MTGVTGGTVRLGDLAFARSGDKGDDANIGLWTHDAATYAHLLRVVTPERVAEHLAALGASRVTRYELPSLLALNLVVHDALDGGGAVSLRSDAQGKTLSLGLLEMLVEAPGVPGRSGATDHADRADPNSRTDRTTTQETD